MRCASTTDAADSVAAVPLRAAVWDLGSSSFHLLVCEVGAGGTLQPALRRRALLNLGSAVGERGDIPPERAAAAVAAARRLRHQLDGSGSDVSVALATAALRDASNGGDIVTRLERVIGQPVRVLDGHEEARLCFVGQRAGVWLPPGFSLGVDLGGGSLEVAVGDARNVEVATSVPVGATRLRGELGTSDPLSADDIEEITARATAGARSVQPLLAPFGNIAARTVVSGGTARALARLATARARRRGGTGEVNQVELPAAQVDELARRLCTMPLAERLALPGMPPRRAPVVPIGALILSATAMTLGVERFVVSEWGLREGALLDRLSQG